VFANVVFYRGTAKKQFIFSLCYSQLSANKAIFTSWFLQDLFLWLTDLALGAPRFAGQAVRGSLFAHTFARYAHQRCACALGTASPPLPSFAQILYVL
jgi:uncharacterized PurR-regulated membrane protein YhhQ (DUF165 family)